MDYSRPKIKLFLLRNGLDPKVIGSGFSPAAGQKNGWFDQK